MSRTRPNWGEVWEDAYTGVRGQLQHERAAGSRPRLGMKSYSDSEIDRYARREAERRCQEAINRWNQGE